MVLVELLGSGNAFLPSGRLHSFLAIDKHIVVDCPPTALASLRKAGISPADIDTILITHVHGDHVFGFPFFLLERKYISDREGLKELTVAGSSGVKERLTHLCNLAYPGSLEEILETINWVDVPNVEGWTMERFEVLHDPEVDPHGWMMTNDEGWSIELEDKYGAHNYHPLPVVLSKGEGIFVCLLLSFPISHGFYWIC